MNEKHSRINIATILQIYVIIMYNNKFIITVIHTISQRGEGEKSLWIECHFIGYSVGY